MSRWLGLQLTIGGLGVDYEMLDAMDCSREQWNEARENRVHGSEVVRALRSFGDDGARRVAMDILTARSLLRPFGLDRMGGHEVFDMLERAIDDSRILVLKRRPAPPTAHATAPQPTSEPPAKRIVLDKFIRVLLFDCQGGAVPSKSGPPSARIEVRTQDGAVYSSAVAAGRADVSAIPGSTPSACQIVFQGVADGGEPVPTELAPAPVPANARAMAQGFLSDPVMVIRRELNKDRPLDAWLNGTNWFQLRRREATVVEFEQFDERGAVLWPGAPPETLVLRDGAPLVLGIESLRAAFEQAQGCDADQVLVTGHDDEVSQERADGIKALLVGDADARKAWVALTLAHAAVTDQQAILKWAATEFGWPCDPGAIDGKKGPKTEAAIRSFQRTYNADQKAALFLAPNPDGPLKVDGIIGKFTTGAMFDCLQRALRGCPSSSSSEASSDSQGALAAPGPKAIGCGANHLQSPFADSPDRRVANRAVEVLFFGVGEAPAVVCTTATGTPCTAKTCELYDPREFALDYVPLDVPGVSNYPFSV